MDYYKSNSENQFKDIQLQLHASSSVSNPYTFSIQGNKSFRGVCEWDGPYDVVAWGGKPWYNINWSEASKVSNLTITDDGAKFNAKNVTTTRTMFYNCKYLTSLDLSNFDTSSVTNMEYMFDLCYGLRSLDLSNFDTSNVINMSSMFMGCTSLQILDYSLTGFEVNGVAPDLSGCTNLKTLRLHHATPSYAANFMVQANVPSTCNMTIVS